MSSFFAPGKLAGTIFMSPPVAGGGGFTVPDLEALTDAGFAAKVQALWGCDRLGYNYSGNTIRLKRSSDSVEADFGFGSNGVFDYSAVNSWRAGSDVTAVKMYDQSGNGRDFPFKSGGSASTVPFITSNTYVRTGSSYSDTDAALTLSGSQGAPMLEITGGKYAELTSSGLSIDNGMEVHMMFAPKLRKVEQNNTTDPFTVDKTAEAYMSYGLSTTNNLLYELSSGNYLHRVRRIGTGAGGTDQSITTGGALKKFAVITPSIRCDSRIRLYANGQTPIDAATSAGNVTANASTDNGTFRIGRRYPGSTGESTSPGNFYFAGAMVTESLTDFERYKVQARMNQIANQHYRAGLDELSDMLGPNGELIDWRDIDMGTGQVVGKKGNLTIQINLATTIGGNSPNWTEDEACPYWGLTGLRSTGDSNEANGFVATTNYFMDVHTGTMGSMNFRINATNNPCQVMASGTNTTIAGLSTTNGLNNDFHISTGYHHNQPNFGGKVIDSIDTAGKTNASAWGDQSNSQQSWKYHFNTANGDVGTAESGTNLVVTPVVGETQTWIAGTPITWANAFTDLGIYPASPESRTYVNWVKAYFAYNDYLCFQCATFNPGGYNPASPVTANMRTAYTKNYAFPGVGTAGLGHCDFSLASKNGWGSAVHGNTSGRLQSQNYTTVFDGVRLLDWFSDTEWSADQVMKWYTNIYKIYTETWPA